MKLTGAVLVALLVVAGCGDDDEPAADTTTTTEASSTSSSSTSTTAASTTTTNAPCGDLAPPAGASDTQTAEADVDGDGKPDVVTTYRLGDGWFIRADLAAGGAAAVNAAPLAAGEVSPIGGVDLDGNGGDEVWARVGSGASATIVGLFAFGECALTKVTLDGNPAEFAVGASVANTSGIECRERSGGAADVLALTSTSSDGETYRTETRTYRLAGSELTQTGSVEKGSVQASSSGFARYTQFRCGELTA